jgi:hypothetical protein
MTWIDGLLDWTGRLATAAAEAAAVPISDRVKRIEAMDWAEQTGRWVDDLSALRDELPRSSAEPVILGRGQRALEELADAVTERDLPIWAPVQAELDRAREAVAALLSGGVPAGWPVALFPVRLEVCFETRPEGGRDLLIRVFHDQVQIDGFEPELTQEESERGRHYWDQRAATPDGAADPAAWHQLVERFGARRAAWVARATGPGAPDPGRREAPWTRADEARLLPDRWVAVGYLNGERVAVAAGRSIRERLQTGPAPGAGPHPNLSGPRVEEGLRWLVDFGAAVEAGMALRMPLGTDVARLDLLVVVGLRASDDPGASAGALAALLDAHHYLDGLGIVPVGTPTNNTGQARSGWSTQETAAAAYRVERGNPLCVAGDGSDGDRLATALGLEAGVFAHVAGADRSQEADARAMNTALWPATWGYFLRQMMAPTLTDAAIGQGRRHFVDWVRAAGPLPSIRVGRQPYGILPVTSLDRFVAEEGEPADAAVTGFLRQLRAVWRTAPVPRVRPGSTSLEDFTRMLEREPVAADFTCRGVFGTEWVASALEFMGIQRQQFLDILQRQQAKLEAALAAVGVPGWRPRVGEAFFLPPRNWALTPPLVQREALGETGPAPAYVADLRLADPLELQRRPADPVNDSLLYLLLRHALLLQHSAAGDAVPPELAELRDSLAHLESCPPATLDRLLRETLDLSAHRLDAWVTSYATKRLARMRAATPEQARGLLVGGWSVLVDLDPAEERTPVQAPPGEENDQPPLSESPGNRGYLHAPSVPQAAAAAVLHSGHLNHPGDAFSFDLSSARVRLAQHLLDGVRQGQTLGALLGYRFERALHEARRDGWIDPFRRLAPQPVTTRPPEPGGSATPSPGTTVDGRKLVELHTGPGIPFGSGGLPAADDPEVPRILELLDELAGARDALGDAVVAESVYQAVQGNPSRAAAALQAAATGEEAPPELEFPRTPRTGIGVTHRLLLAFGPTPEDAPSWPTGPDQARALAEPMLNAWLGALFGDPAKVAGAVSFRSLESGAELARRPVRLDELRLSPLDLLHAAANPSEVEERLFWLVRPGHRPQGVPDDAVVEPVLGRPAAGPGETSFAEVLEVARAAGDLVATSRALEGRDLVAPGGQAASGVDLGELAGRADAVAAVLDRVGEALGRSLDPDGTVRDQDAAREAILAAASFGIRDAIPRAADLEGEGALARLGFQAGLVAGEVARRRERAAELLAALDDPARDPPATDQDRVDAQLGRVAAILGPAFRFLPRFRPSQPGELEQAFATTQVIGDDQGEHPLTWLGRVGQVRPGAAMLDTVALYGEALGTRPALALSVGQLPPGGRWVGRSLDGQAAMPGGRLSLVHCGPEPPDASGLMSGLLIDDWVEVVPSRRETTAVSFHFDTPASEAPQVVLLAVPPRPDAATWEIASLEGIVAEALDLAKLRLVDAGMVGSAEPFLPGLFLADQVEGETVTVAAERLAALPEGFGTPTIAPVPQVERLDRTTAEQTEVFEVTVTGTGFLAETSFAVTGGGVRTEVVGVVDATTARLRLAVELDAVPGPRGLAVQTIGGASERPGVLTILARPVLTGIDPTVFWQSSVDTSVTAVISGVRLAGATAVTTDFGDASIVGGTDTSLTVTIWIWGNPPPPPDRNGGGDWINEEHEQPAHFSVTIADGRVLASGQFGIACTFVALDYRSKF